MLMNVPEYASEYRWLIVTRVGAEHWFYGAYADESRADAIAYDLRHNHGQDVSVMENPGYQGA